MKKLYFLLSMLLLAFVANAEEAVINYSVGEGGTMMVSNGLNAVPNGSSLEVGKKLSLLIKSVESYVVDHLLLNDVEDEAAAGKRDYIKNLTVEGDLTIKVTFRKDNSSLEFYPIYFSVGEGGTLTAIDATDKRELKDGDDVIEGRTVLLTAYANINYMIDKFIVNGFEWEPASGQNIYQYDLQMTHESTVSVTFKPNPAAIDAVAADEEEAVYYNLQGIRVIPDANGLYIKVAGSKTEKVYLSK